MEDLTININSGEIYEYISVYLQSVVLRDFQIRIIVALALNPSVYMLVYI